MHTQRYRRLLQAGFTLIELIIVIVIIGVLAAVAIPKYNDLTQEARIGVLKGAAGSMASAAATNYALRAGGLPGQGASLTCAAVAGLTTLPSEVIVGAGTLVNGTNTTACPLSHSGGSGTYTVSPIGAS